MRPLEPTDLAFLDAAPLRITRTVRVGADPARVFESFTDPASWPRWFPLLASAAWTSGTGGVGAEREVSMRAGLGAYRERMTVWEPGVRFAFTMIGTTSPLARRMAEDYQLAPDGGGTRIDWVMAVEPTGLGRVIGPGMRLLMSRLFARGAVNLDRLLASSIPR